MEYRRLDYSKDIKEVVSLIKRNLNSNYSEDILKWKHLESPNGKSVGVVALDDFKIVGVVFAVLYVFQNNSGNKIRSIRYFDACTDCDYRGKGIFKTLMMMGLNDYGNEFDFSFSNPNKASLKGHLKMGYQEPNKERFYKLGLIKPIIGKIGGILQNFQPYALDENPLMKQNFYLTANSLSFIKWRYREKRYIVLEHLEGNQKNHIIYRIEKKRGFRAIVVCDYLGNLNKFHQVLNKVCRREKTFLVYYLENQLTLELKFLLARKYKKAVIVFKDKNNNQLNNLVISLGDLEGRL